MPMTTMTNLEKLKLKTKESDETLLSLLLSDAEEYVLTETNRTILPDKLQGTVRDLALIAYNRLGTEGETSRTEAGESYSFDNAPAHIQKAINRYRIARCGGVAHEAKQEEDDTSEES